LDVEQAVVEQVPVAGVFFIELLQRSHIGAVAPLVSSTRLRQPERVIAEQVLESFK
jgi:hypothetical protein